MSKVGVNLKKGNKDFYLQSTELENLFINEFMLIAPGNFVKLYIYGLMKAQHSDELDMQETANVLSMLPSEVKEGWEYWAKNGVVKLQLREDEEIEEIEFLSLIGKLYGSNQQNKAEESSAMTGEAAEATEDDVLAMRMEQLVNEELRMLYEQYEEVTGHTISHNEIKKLSEAIKVYNVSVDVMSYAIKYCAELEKYSIDYMFKVALRWTKDGCRDILQVKENLDRYSRRNEQYGQIFKEMGFTRFPTPADKEMINRWFDEMGCTIKEVIDACRTTAGQREPSLKYVNKVLENRQLEAGGINTRTMTAAASNTRTGQTQLQDQEHRPETAKVSKKVLDEYYEYLRNESEREQHAHIDELTNSFEEMRTLFEYENKINAEIFSSSTNRTKRAELKEKRSAIETEKKKILVENGYPEDYIDRKYLCTICGDTGITDEGINCSCKKARAEEAYKWYQARTK